MQACIVSRNRWRGRQFCFGVMLLSAALLLADVTPILSTILFVVSLITIGTAWGWIISRKL